MSGERRALARYVRRQVAAYSPHYAGRLGSGRGGRRIELTSLPLSALGDVADPAALVLRPTEGRIRASGASPLRARMSWSRLWRRQAAFGRRVEQRYKPVHWHLDAGVPVGYSGQDLDRLGRLGALLLEAAGIGPYDVLVGLAPARPGLAFWEPVLGARSAGVSSVFLGPEAQAGEVVALDPSALLGPPRDLARLLRDVLEGGWSVPRLRTLLAVGEPLVPGVRQRLASLGAVATGGVSSVAVVAAWAPAGVRALWSECRGGTTFHTWPDAGVIELVDPLSGTPAPPGADGEVVWTPLGWYGTVLLRLRTGAYATEEASPCPSCRRRGTRLRLVSNEPPFARVLDSHPGVAGWQAELRTVGGAEELIVFLAPVRGADLASLLGDLDRQLSATQFVVMSRPALEARVAAGAASPVLDLRL